MTSQTLRPALRALSERSHRGTRSDRCWLSDSVNDQAAAVAMRSLENRALDYTLATATYWSAANDWPEDSGARAAAPLALCCGACGVAHVLKQAGRECPTSLINWMRTRSADCAQYPPGLMVGLAGIGWTFWDLGFTDEGQQLIAMALAHPHLLRSASASEGSSGVGLAALWMYARTNDRRYVDEARRIGDHLWSTAAHGEGGVFWPSPDHAVRLGYLHGASGVAAFLLYLYLVTGEWRWLRLGRQALEFDVVRSTRLCEARSKGSHDEKSARTPVCWEHGIAGIAAVLARYYAVLGTEPYEAALRMMTETLLREIPGRSIGYFRGLAGIGQFFLDLGILCRSVRAERWAFRIADAITSCVYTSEGSLFSEDQQSNLHSQTALATGAAGIALFLNCLQTTQTSSFMLDELLNRDQLQKFAVCPS